MNLESYLTPKIQLVRWKLPKSYKHYLRTTWQCETKYTPSHPAQWKYWWPQWMQTKETVIKASLGWLQLRQLSNTWKYVLYFLVQKQYALFKGKFGTLCFVFNFSVFCLKACYALFSSKYVSCNQWYLLLQEVNRECNGNFYDPTSANCSSKLSKVDEVI